MNPSDKSLEDVSLPPRRRLLGRLFTWRNARRLLIGLAVLVTLFALFVTEENLRGAYVWNKFKRTFEAQGERFELEAIVPAPVPDDQNFAMTPLLAPLLDYQYVPGQAEPRWRDTNAYARAKALNPYGKGTVKEAGRWRTGHGTELAAWQAHYRQQEGFPRAAQPQTPGADVLLALSKFNPEVEELRAAVLRPHSHFKVHYDELFRGRLEHLVVLRQANRLVALRAAAALAEGKTDAALADTLLGLRVTGALRQEPFLISWLVRMAQLEIALQPVWEGLARRAWSQAQWLELQRQLEAIDLLASFGPTMRGERNLGLKSVDAIGREPRLASGIVNEEGQPASESSGFRLMPSGWYAMNKYYLAKLYQDWVFPLVDASAQRVYLDKAREYERSAERTQRGFYPYRVLAAMLFPAMSKATLHAAASQTAVHQALLACALERYRQAKGQFPETLAALTPDFLARLPHDLVTGEPLKYRRTGEDRYLLYAVGANGQDDGGQVVRAKSDRASIDFNQGDWVWPFPAN